MIDELQKTYNFISTQWLPLTGKLISDVENFSQQILPTITEENEDEIFDDTKCINFLAKAVRELNLMYIEQADAKYVADHPNEVSAQRPEKLFDLGYIDFIPTDYQQYNDEGYAVIYKYNEDIGRFDYKMSY